mmetsp:Transcript_119409/g.380826  ORF Transcript_119409/g.380826 Transcript_119409/m.380826 type:complete len:201 (+) Transcript_119409:194-796(+)
MVGHSPADLGDGADVFCHVFGAASAAMGQRQPRCRSPLPRATIASGHRLVFTASILASRCGLLDRVEQGTREVQRIAGQPLDQMQMVLSLRSLELSQQQAVECTSTVSQRSPPRILRSGALDRRWQGCRSGRRSHRRLCLGARILARCGLGKFDSGLPVQACREWKCPGLRMGPPSWILLQPLLVVATRLDTPASRRLTV